MKKSKRTIYACGCCGYQSPKWLGKCPDCGTWDSLEEQASFPETRYQEAAPAAPGDAEPVPIDAVAEDERGRIPTGNGELDRVLGGGLVPGSVVLIGGDPGIGKSTLMLQALHRIAESGRKVLYVSGEESPRQIRMRAGRLNALSQNLYVVSEILLDRITALVERDKPQVLVLDSVQTLYSPELASAPGTVSQIREVCLRLTLMAKRTGLPCFLVGHVTKDGAIAGPRLLEHMVDTVLYFEGDRNHVFRVLRAVKNRFGSTNEIGVFEMAEGGLAEVPNPSAVFLSERPRGAPGSVVSASMEGTRPILLEIQALASPTNFSTPRRTVLGLDPNRVALLVAVLEKKLGYPLMAHDVYMNVAGGVRVTEPAVDLGVVAAVASSFLDRPVPERTMVVGEVGLAGEIRAVGQLETRVREAAKMGFDHCVVPESNLRAPMEGLEVRLTGVRTVGQAMGVLF
jgi:DNA repair protein RadA/Sms